VLGEPRKELQIDLVTAEAERGSEPLEVDVGSSVVSDVVGAEIPPGRRRRPCRFGSYRR